MPPELIERATTPVLSDMLASRRVVLITGPRQAGKTTLAQQLVARLGRGTVRSLDERDVLAAALEDPHRFVRAGEPPIVIDEIQRGGDPVVRAIKLAVDRDRTPGQFVLTGSSDFLSVPTISESLAGRVGIIDLWPLTQGEMSGRADRFVDAVFTRPDGLADLGPSDLDTLQYLTRLCAGGYPEVQGLPEGQRAPWFRDYVRTTIQRDVVELSGIRKVAETRQLLSLIAARTGGELVLQHVVKEAQLERQAVYDRVAWLEITHLIRRIPAWSRNIASRTKRHPKVYVTDPGLAAALMGKDAVALADPVDPAAGALLESFVAAELWRQAAWSGTPVEIYHYRDRNGPEVDLVLESADGRVVGVEVKKTGAAAAGAFRWLALLRDRLGDRFVHGVVLHTGRDILPFGDRLTAAPIDLLWRA